MTIPAYPWTAAACCRFWQCSLLRADGIGISRHDHSPSSAADSRLSREKRQQAAAVQSYATPTKI